MLMRSELESAVTHATRCHARHRKRLEARGRPVRRQIRGPVSAMIHCLDIAGWELRSPIDLCDEGGQLIRLTDVPPVVLAQRYLRALWARSVAEAVRKVVHSHQRGAETAAAARLESLTNEGLFLFPWCRALTSADLSVQERKVLLLYVGGGLVTKATLAQRG